MRHLLPALSVLVFLALPPVFAGSKDGTVVMPFNGKNLDGWKLKNTKKEGSWTVGSAKVDPANPNQFLPPEPTSAPGAMVNVKNGGVDIYSEDKWGDCRIEVELMVPKGSNSGIYVM